VLGVAVRHHCRMELRPGLTLDDAFVTAFVATHGIRRLALYGSALRADFHASSDIDLLVEFEPGSTPGLLHLAQMELELEDALGREVELRTPEDLSPYFRDAVTTTARQLYAA
jgi:predicted nucleotidyltransferase